MNKFKLLLTACALFAFQWANAQYCTPTFPVSGNCGTLMSFTTTGADVNLNYTPNNAGLKPNAVVGNRIEAVPNQTLTLNLNITTFWAYAHLYVDTDGNGQFEQNEMIGKFGDLTGHSYFNESIGIPCKINGAAPTYTVPMVPNGTILRFRVINGNTTVDGAEPNPCSGWREGSYMDFELLVKNPVFEKITLNDAIGGTYTVTDQSGTIVNSNSDIAVGSKLTVNSTPDEGYQVKEIKVNGTAIVGNQFTFTGESTVDVVFTNDLLLALPTPENYTLTVRDNDNNELTNGSSFAKGKNLTLTFAPATGYEISVLTINGEDKLAQLQNNALTLTDCQANVTVAATASKKKFAVTFNTPVSGTGTLTVRNETAGVNLQSGDLAEYGSNLTISAKASAISTFVSFKINGEDRKPDLVGDKLTMLITESLNIEAEFVATQYTLAFTSTGNGGGELKVCNTNDGDREVASGSKVVKNHYLFLEMTPNAGSTVSSIKMNETEVDLTDDNYDLEKKSDHWILWFEMTEDFTFEVTFTDPNSIADVQNDLSIIYNPESAMLTLPLQAQATVFDLSGKAVRIISESTTSLKELPAGVYLIKATTATSQKTIKIVKK